MAISFFLGNGGEFAGPVGGGRGDLVGGGFRGSNRGGHRGLGLLHRAGRNHPQEVSLHARGHFFLGGGLRLQLGDVLPTRVLGGRGAAIGVAFLDFQEGVLAQRGEVNAHLGLHSGLREEILNLALHFLVGSLSGFEAFVHFEDQEGSWPPDDFADEALLLREHQVFDRLVHQAFGHRSDLAAVLGRLDVIGVIRSEAGRRMTSLTKPFFCANTKSSIGLSIRPLDIGPIWPPFLAVSTSSELSRASSLNFSPFWARAARSLAFFSATATCSGVLPSVEMTIWLRNTCDSLRIYSDLCSS